MQFHPLVYMLKLYIEMGIADLIVKVVRATDSNVTPSPYSHSHGMGVNSHNGGGGANGGNDTELRSRPNLGNMFAPAASKGGSSRGMLGGKTACETGTETTVQADGGGKHGFGTKSGHSHGSNSGITKIVKTTVSSHVVNPKGDLDDTDASSQSSTGGLRKNAAWGDDDRV